MPSYKSREGVPVDAQRLAELVQPFAAKFSWFLSKGYEPHTWQTLFHTLRNDDDLCRFRHLVAGRRGGKTLSAAWELLYYLLHPQEFHRDAHGKASSEPLLAWALTRDYPLGVPALMTFRNVLRQAGLEHGKEYKENRGHKYFEFANGCYLFFKTADEPNNLRGAGLDILWIDESAFIPNVDAWDVVYPALSDKQGLVITTTTPDGKNWFYDKFWTGQAQADPNIGRVEYWSIDNPYFPEEEWLYAKTHMHPLLFKREYCAAFDAMAGKELSGDWLHYYTHQDLPRHETGKIKPLTTFVGVDPAISLSDKADRFAIACIGVAEDRSQAYLIDIWAGRIPFPEQLDKISEFHQRWRPQLIGIESVAYQAALAQQALRLPGFLPIVAMMTGGKKKSDRILSMSPIFKTGRIKVRKDQHDFIDEWIDYDSELKNPKDDCLDAVEIALRTASAILPGIEPESELMWLPEDLPTGSLDELAKRQRGRFKRKQIYDEALGTEW